MKTLIIYASKTGTTEKCAKKILLHGNTESLDIFDKLIMQTVRTMK